MAKCKNCGKEIPNGGVCSCTSANNNKSGSAAAVKESGLKKFFKGDSFIEWLGLIVLIIILVMITIFAIGSPKHGVKKFAKALTKENGAKSYFAMVYPDEFLENIKSKEYIERHPSIKSWDNELSDYKSAKKEEFSSGKLKVEKVEKISRLSTDGVNSASNYFKTKFSVQNYHCTKGYEYKITFDKEGTDTPQVYNVCVVKLKTDGWKIIEMNEERLIDEY
ncbi:MAG: hypothetical protein IJ010_06525 [Ruminococcus sp.]|nr:hypothetical protein [Ruminococcus sp.]